MMHYRVNAGYLPPDHWLLDPHQGGGRIIGEGCHFIDFLTFLAGAPPLSVITQGLPDAGRYHEDNVVITIKLTDGSIGTIGYQANGDRAFPKERVEVFGGGRVAVLDDFRSLELVAGGRRQKKRSIFRQDKGFQAQWEAFTAAIQAGGPPTIPYDQLFAVTLASFAAVESLRSGKSVKVEPLAIE
jgi:predicted dehydrogenase